MSGDFKQRPSTGTVGRAEFVWRLPLPLPSRVNEPVWSPAAKVANIGPQFYFGFDFLRPDDAERTATGPVAPDDDACVFLSHDAHITSIPLLANVKLAIISSVPGKRLECELMDFWPGGEVSKLGDHCQKGWGRKLCAYGLLSAADSGFIDANGMATIEIVLTAYAGAAAHEQLDVDTRLAVLESIDELREDDSLCDVTVSSGEWSFPAHKAILSAGSEFFEALFDSKMQESEEGKVVLDSIEPAVLDSVLAFLYSGTCPSDPEQLDKFPAERECKGPAAPAAAEGKEAAGKDGSGEEKDHLASWWCKLYAAADQLGVETMKEYCLLKLQGMVEAESFAYILLLADRYDVAELKELCGAWIKQDPGTRLSQVATSRAFCQLSREDTGVVMACFRPDKKLPQREHAGQKKRKREAEQEKEEDVKGQSEPLPLDAEEDNSGSGSSSSGSGGANGGRSSKKARQG